MAKGLFTQGLVVLLERPVSLDELSRCLDGYEILGRKEGSDAPEIGGPSLIVSYLPAQNGCASIDIFPSPWPDHTGDPQKDPNLFGSWGMGYFGPLTYPGGLARAVVQSWRWNEAKDAVSKHTAALRISMSYVFGAGGSAPILPENYDPKAELIFLTNLAAKFSALEEAICYFNPGGEVLLPFPQLRESLQHHAEHDLPPLDAWANIRLFNLNEEWVVMDCVGNWQLDTFDHEAGFPRSLTDPRELDRFIRNVTLYLLTKGDVIKDGDTINGPAGQKWQAHRVETGLNDPPRKVLRWLPCDISDIPQSLLDGRAAPMTPQPEKKPFWKFW